MKALMIACSRQACARMYELKKIWERQEPEAEITCVVKCAALPELSEKESLTDCVGRWFHQADAILFLCASGIAVRSIAPWIAHKSEDPAVIVMDETLKFCIPLLSGHWGGANALAQRLARMTGAVPVITTATDREEKFAVDVFARKNGLLLNDWKLAKRISARILEGEKIGFYSELLVEGAMPEELAACMCAADAEAQGEPSARIKSGQRLKRFEGRAGIAISCRRKARELFAETLPLVPRTVAAGVGCKRGTPREKIEAAVQRCLEETGICPEAVYAVASIDLKREEAGILSYCKEAGIEFLTFTAEELRAVPGDFTASGFVESVTGVENVCERSAVAAALSGGAAESGAAALSGGAVESEAAALSGGAAESGAAPCGGAAEHEAALCGNGEESAAGVLLCRKRIYGGVTVALAQRKASVRF